MRSIGGGLVAILLVVAACGGDDGTADAPDATAPDTAGTDTAGTDTTGTDTTDADTTDAGPAAPTTEPAPTALPTTAAPTTEPAPTLPPPAPWDAPRFEEAIEPTMAALAVGVGQPVSAAAVGPEVLLPETVPTPGGVVVGAGWVSEFDPRRDEYEVTYSVGLDATLTPAELEAWQTTVGESGTGWRAPSFSESGPYFTSLLIDEQDQRLVHLLDTDAATSGRPPLNLEWSPATDTLIEPDWLASLPHPDGGTTTEVLVGRGDVVVGLGGTGLDGNVFVRTDYEVDDLDRMIDYFESGILVGAGFEYEPEPLSTSRYRRDVAIGDWSGEVQIGDASANGVEYLQVIWQLTRDAP